MSRTSAFGDSVFRRLGIRREVFPDSSVSDQGFIAGRRALMISYLQTSQTALPRLCGCLCLRLIPKHRWSVKVASEMRRDSRLDRVEPEPLD